MTPLSFTASKELVDLAMRFIAIEGHIEHPYYERDIAAAVEKTLRVEGIPVQTREVAPNRFNVMAQLGETDGPTLVLNTHLDTIPAYGMKEAFLPQIKNGLLRGRGACDVRGALACLCTAMIHLHRKKAVKRGKVIFLATCDEESGSLGARDALQTLQADAAIICEPTGLNIGVAHKGVEWFQADFSGKAAHSGDPTKGENAIHKAARFAEAVRLYEQNELQMRKHPLIGPSTINIGTIHGGSKPTVVPDACTITFDRRWIPSEARQQVWRELEKLCASEGATLQSLLGGEAAPLPPMELAESAPVLQSLQKAQETISGEKRPVVGVPFWTEAALFTEMGKMQAVVLGPGYGEHAHSTEETVPIDQLVDACRIYIEAARHFCA